jgi:hypothetical protein
MSDKHNLPPALPSEVGQLITEAEAITLEAARTRWQKAGSFLLKCVGVIGEAGSNMLGNPFPPPDPDYSVFITKPKPK